MPPGNNRCEYCRGLGEPSARNENDHQKGQNLVPSPDFHSPGALESLGLVGSRTASLGFFAGMAKSLLATSRTGNPRGTNPNALRGRFGERLPLGPPARTPKKFNF